MSFTSAHPALQSALTERGYASPTPVQAAVLDAPAGRDLLVSAQTGSGKTVAFGLALARELLGEATRIGAPGAPLALIVAPTRELALQVQRELAWLYAGTGARVAACVGGMDPRREARALGDGVHLVVGTPGRLCDHLERGTLDLGRVRAVVLDEADEMLDLGFREELEQLLQATPTERLTLLFSATVAPEIESLAARYQRDALRVAVGSTDEPHRDIEYRAVLHVPREREHAVVNLLRHLDPPGALVFCTTREAVAHLYGNLLERGFAVVALSGELTQNERNRALQALRDRRARVCVATDVAARGLDLPDLGLVIHADLPRDPATLLHRSGRTGRAGRKGTAVLLVPMSRRRLAERLVAAAKLNVRWSAAPTAEQIRERDEARLRTAVAAMAAEVAEEDLVTARALIAEGDAERLVAALVRAQRASLPAPEEITVPSAPPVRERPARGPEAGPVRALRPERLPEGSVRSRPLPEGGEGRPTRPRAPAAGGAWFRINVGRNENADPRWLLPLLCRRGRVGREAIGQIRIFPHETRFEVDPAVADQFAWAARQPDPREPGIRIAAVRERGE